MSRQQHRADTAADAIEQGRQRYKAVTAKPRFSKATLQQYLDARLASLEARYGFRRSDGWDQVIGKGEAVNRAYGEYDALLGVMEEFCA